MKLKKIWNRRFHAWVWLFLPLLFVMLMQRLLVWAGALPEPAPRVLAIRLAVHALGLALAGVGVWRIGRAMTSLLRDAHNLANGRVETRAQNHWWGVTGRLADEINNLGRQVTYHRDHIDEIVMQTTARLRLDQDRLQALNQELRNSLADSRKAAEAQSELFSNLSHELRTPLTAVLGYTDLLRRSGLNREQESHIATLDKSARGMLTMINDLLDWSRIEVGRLKLNEDLLDVLEAVEDITALLAPLAYEKDLELVSIVYHDVPRRLRGDPQRLRQILTNLLSNAIKFTPRGEVVLRVMRDREEKNRVWLSFSVSDTGPGISTEQQKRLFQPFHQVPGAKGGSGLGLTITRKLAELMGGRVDMQSAPGQGSTFSAVVPLKLAGEGPAAPAPDTHLRERVAWVMEPHPVARLALTHWLEFWGMRVRIFEDARVLSAALASGAPDVVITGLKEADAASPDHLALFRQCAGGRPPLLALMASASIELHSRVRAAGAAGCLPKSVSQLSLLRELVRLTSLKPAQTLPLAGRRALIADNNAPNRLYIATLCRELGLDTQEAADGQDALRRWRSARPDFVLLDARMPEMDGLACARAIRADDPGHRSRIIAVSAHLEPEERQAFLADGADGVLLKPFDGRELLRMLAPQMTEAPPPVSEMLTADPEMLTLLREELPLQFRELEDTLERRDLPAARDAAHQLRGTAAFYHIAALKQATAALDRHLAPLPDLDSDPLWPARLAAVREAMAQTLSQLGR